MHTGQSQVNVNKGRRENVIKSSDGYWVPEIGYAGTWNQSKNGFKAS